ncbi:hypothetical protein BGX34_000674 [Mortierella sp. NVP85]|nr:hypothetical protein BGX34_000674 [Mortierella sp. NVP85]
MAQNAVLSCVGKRPKSSPAVVTYDPHVSSPFAPSSHCSQPLNRNTKWFLGLSTIIDIRLLSSVKPYRCLPYGDNTSRTLLIKTVDGRTVTLRAKKDVELERWYFVLSKIWCHHLQLNRQQQQPQPQYQHHDIDGHNYNDNQNCEYLDSDPPSIFGPRRHSTPPPPHSPTVASHLSAHQQSIHLFDKYLQQQHQPTTDKVPATPGVGRDCISPFQTSLSRRNAFLPHGIDWPLSLRGREVDISDDGEIGSGNNNPEREDVNDDDEDRNVEDEGGEQGDIRVFLRRSFQDSPSPSHPPLPEATYPRAYTPMGLQRQQGRPQTMDLAKAVAIDRWRRSLSPSLVRDHPLVHPLDSDVGGFASPRTSTTKTEEMAIAVDSKQIHRVDQQQKGDDRHDFSGSGAVGPQASPLSLTMKSNRSGWPLSCKDPYVRPRLVVGAEATGNGNGNGDQNRSLNDDAARAERALTPSSIPRRFSASHSDPSRSLRGSSYLDHPDFTPKPGPTIPETNVATRESKENVVSWNIPILLSSLSFSPSPVPELVGSKVETRSIVPHEAPKSTPLLSTMPTATASTRFDTLVNRPPPIRIPISLNPPMRPPRRHPVTLRSRKNVPILPHFMEHSYAGLAAVSTTAVDATDATPLMSSDLKRSSTLSASILSSGLSQRPSSQGHQQNLNSNQEQGDDSDSESFVASLPPPRRKSAPAVAFRRDKDRYMGLEFGMGMGSGHEHDGATTATLLSPSMTVATTTLTTWSSEQGDRGQVDIPKTKVEMDGDGDHHARHETVQEATVATVVLAEAATPMQEPLREKLDLKMAIHDASYGCNTFMENDDAVSTYSVESFCYF